jgi:hypothetical protein
MRQRDTHLRQVNQNIKPKTPNGCEECLQIGSDWVHCVDQLEAVDAWVSNGYKGSII